MWDPARRELAVITWGAAPTRDHGLLAEWARTVPDLLRLYRSLGRLSPQDPFALTAIATAGAVRAAGADPDPAPDLAPLRRALRAAQPAAEALPAADRDRHLPPLTHLAYELVHTVRVSCTSPAAQSWLWAAETALDGALHLPRRPSRTAAALADWQEALAVVQTTPDQALLQHGVALGHLALLRTTHTLLNQAEAAQALPADYLDALRADIGALIRGHQAVLDQVGRHPEQAPDHEATLRKLGRAVAALTRPDRQEPAHLQLDALLRSGLGHAGIVLHLTHAPDSHRATQRLQRLTAGYLAHPHLLRDGPWPAPRPAAPAPTVIAGPLPARRTHGVETSHPRGVRLDHDAVAALCRARDLGETARTADPHQPPDALHGHPPTSWPALIAAGERAVADLVASVYPIAFVLTRTAGWHAGELRSAMFVDLVRAAHLYNPDRHAYASWPTYARNVMEHTRLHARFDPSGLPPRRHRPVTVSLDKMTDERRRVPAARHADPADLYTDPAEHDTGQRVTFDDIDTAIGQLPSHLRRPLQLSLDGHTLHEIAHHEQISVSTVYRRLHTARTLLAPQLLHPTPPAETPPAKPSPTTPATALARADRLTDHHPHTPPPTGPRR